MPPPSVLKHTRRPLLALAVALPLLAAAPAEARLYAGPLGSHAGAADDSTADALAWAGRVVALRRALDEADQARPEAAAVLASEAFGEARHLAEDPASEGDATVRALLLDAQALYERYHGPVAPAALSAEELGALRGPSLVGLASAVADPTLLAPTPVSPAALVPATLLAPETAEALIAREERRMLRIYGGVDGIARRTRRYFPMIEQALAQRGLPEELKYVAFIESGMNPGAVSPAGALGMWQMLPSTGAMYGLSANALTHPTRSTGAATRYLAYLGELFDGDWQLALAAYNCGPGRVQGLVTRLERRLGRTPTFWDLYPHLPAETRTYVPRFIAVARAVEEAA